MLTCGRVCYFCDVTYYYVLRASKVRRKLGERRRRRGVCCSTESTVDGQHNVCVANSSQGHGRGGGGMDGLAERRTTLTRRHFVNSTILMGCRTPPVMGSAAPHQCSDETTASFVGYADVRTFD